MEYFILKPDGEQTGTFSIDQIRSMLNKGVIGPDTRYWHEGIAEWRPIEQIEESLNFIPPPPAEPGSPQSMKIPPTSRAVPPHAVKVEKAAVAPAPTAKGARQPRVISLPSPVREISPAEPEAVLEPAPAATQPADGGQPRRTRSFHWIIYVILISIIFAALAFDYFRPPPPPSPVVVQNKVTLAGNAIYVLLNRSMIKPFADDLRNSTVATALQHQLTQTTDPGMLLKLKLGLETELTRHADEVKQRYIQSGQAEFIDPGTYTLLDYLDNNGEPTTPRDDASVWEVILYKDQTVYVLRPASAAPTTAGVPSN